MHDLDENLERFIIILPYICHFEKARQTVIRRTLRCLTRRTSRLSVGSRSRSTHGSLRPLSVSIEIQSRFEFGDHAEKKKIVQLTITTQTQLFEENDDLWIWTSWIFFRRKCGVKFKKVTLGQAAGA